MKTKFFIIYFVVSFNCLYSQVLDWAPVGAMWYYNVWVGMDGNGSSYVVFRVEKDTIFNGQLCKKIIIDSHLSGIPVSNAFLPFGCETCPPYSLSFERNDSIYFYAWQCNSFKFVAYDNINTSGTWSFDKCDNGSYWYPINYIDTLMWGNFKLKRLGYQNASGQITSFYLSRIGYLNTGLGPIPYGIVDFAGTNKLRCYYHPVHGWLQYDVSVSCTYTTTSVEKISIENNPKIYFNDRDELIVLLPVFYYPLYIQIFNIMGVNVDNFYLEHPHPINLSSACNGILFIIIKDVKGNRIMRKIFHSSYN